MLSGAAGAAHMSAEMKWLWVAFVIFLSVSFFQLLEHMQ
jgi:hypothetical protein